MNQLLTSASLLWLAATILKSVAVLAFALFVRRLMRRRSAAHRHAVIATAIIATLALPVLSLVAPRWSVNVPVPRPAIATLVPQVAPVAIAAAPVRSPHPRPTSGQRFRQPSQEPAFAPAPVMYASQPNTPVKSPLAWPSPENTVLLVWIFGATIIAVRFLVSRIRLSALLRKCSAVADSQLLASAHRVAHGAAPKRTPDHEKVGRLLSVLPSPKGPTDEDHEPRVLRREILLRLRPG